MAETDPQPRIGLHHIFTIFKQRAEEPIDAPCIVGVPAAHTPVLGRLARAGPNSETGPSHLSGQACLNSVLFFLLPHHSCQALYLLYELA